MLLFEFSGPKLVSIPYFSPISLKMTELFKDFTFLITQILQGTFCNFVAMVTPDNVTNWYDLENVSQDVSLKSESFSLIA